MLWILFAFIGLGSCREPIIQPPSDTDGPENTLNIVWKIALLPDTSECSSIDPIYYNATVLISGEKVFSTENTILKSLNAESGDLMWVWNNVLEDGGEKITSVPPSSICFENIYSVTAGDDIMTIDLNNGSTLWSTEIDYGFSQLSGEANVLFHCRTSEGIGPDYVYLMNSNIYTESWDTVIVFNEDEADGYSPSVPTVSCQINNDGDTILYFQNRQWNFSTSDGKIDFYAFNMSADTIVWKIDDLDPEGNSSVCPPLFYDNKIYFKGSRILYCLDAADGHTIWSNDYSTNGGDILLSNMLLIDDKLILKEGHDYLYAVNPQTGSEIWTNNDGGGSPSYMTYYNGNIYYGSGGDGKLHVVSVASGQTVKAFDSPGEDMPDSPNAGFYDGVAIDPVHNYLYAADGYYLYCIKIEW